VSAEPTDRRRVALIHSGLGYVGPSLARLLADRGHDLVIADPADGLVEDLEARGAAVEVVTDASNPSREGATDSLVAAALDRFGRLDAASAFSGQIVVGRFVEDATIEDFQRVVTGCMEGPFRFLKSVVPAMQANDDGGQVLVITSATANRATKGASLYSMARAGATHLVRNVAAEVAATNVQVNAVGTNFMDFPEFLAATGATDPAVRAAIESRVPMQRLGTMDEFAAMCAVFLDGTSRFTTGQFVSYAGGW
jgi:3-oxoacyl-[acyl-carrier protein] reductase